MSEKILLTAFEPWHNIEENPSKNLVSYLSEHWSIGGYDLITKFYPVEYSIKESISLDCKEQPILSVHFGYSHYSKGLCLETLARNFPYDKKDGKGMLFDGKVVENGPDVLFTRFVVENIKAQYDSNNFGTAMEISNDAGNYLCEFLYYNFMYESFISTRNPVIFVHVPEITNMEIFAHDVTAMIGILIQELRHLN